VQLAHPSGRASPHRWSGSTFGDGRLHDADLVRAVAYRKISIRNRAGAAAYMARHGSRRQDGLSCSGSSALRAVPSTVSYL
jgi:hypothetical protein